MDSIFLKDIKVWTHIGVPEAERSKAQCLLVSLELYGSLKKVSTTDDITFGTDYAKVTHVVTELATSERKTIECFAEDIATVILKNFTPERVKVTICKKPDLPLDVACVTLIRP